MKSRVTTVVLAAVVCIAGSASGAQARKNNRGMTSGGKQGKSYSGGAEQRIVFSGSGGGSPQKGGGNLAPVSGNWEAPPCWYAPMYSPQQLKEKVEDNAYGLTGRERPAGSWEKQETVPEIVKRYTKGKYKNFNLKKKGEGSFWAAVPNPEEKDRAKAHSCGRLPFWVKNGERPKVERAISPEILAALAYERVRVPDTRVELNPEAKQTVRLPTWAWLDKGEFRPVSVTARVDLGAGEELSATTTVKPVGLSIDPGTEDARLHPASGTCPVGEDGGIGTPYAKGKSGQTPPCGVTYLRATPKGGSFPLRGTVTWKAAWHGSDGAGGELPDGEFGSGQDVTVQEIQSIVR